jgi:hypothetical protein
MAPEARRRLEVHRRARFEELGLIRAQRAELTPMANSSVDRRTSTA